MHDTVITVTGRIVDVPKRRVTEGGRSVTNFRVVSTSRRLDPETKQWSDGDSLYLSVSCWQQLADNVSRSLVKGDPIVVTGRIFTREYELDGQRRRSYDLVAAALGPDLNWGQVEFTRIRRDVATHEVIDTEATAEAEEGTEIDADDHTDEDAGAAFDHEPELEEVLA